MSLNRVTLVGNLGADPKLYSNEGNKSVCKFRMATTENFRKKDGQYDHHTEWHNLVAFGKVAEICGKYLKKGSHVYLEGRLRTEEYSTSTGERRKSTQIVVTTITSLNGQVSPKEGETPEQTFVESANPREQSTIFDMDDASL